MILFKVNGKEEIYLPWTWDGNNRSFLRFMATVLNGEVF